MTQSTPHPPETAPAPTDYTLDAKLLQEAANRAIDFYLNPAAHIMFSQNAYAPMYRANPGCNTEALLANASETLGSASEMINNFAATLDSAHRKTALGIATVVMVA